MVISFKVKYKVISFKVKLKVKRGSLEMRPRAKYGAIEEILVNKSKLVQLPLNF